MYLQRRRCFFCVDILIATQVTCSRAKLSCQRELTTLCADRANVIILLRKHVRFSLQIVARRINSGKYSRHTYFPRIHPRALIRAMN